jgi:choline kinase
MIIGLRREDRCGRSGSGPVRADQSSDRGPQRVGGQAGQLGRQCGPERLRKICQRSAFPSNSIAGGAARTACRRIVPERTESGLRANDRTPCGDLVFRTRPQAEGYAAASLRSASRPTASLWSRYRAVGASPPTGAEFLATGTKSDGKVKVMIGLVLAAGQGQRLRPYTDSLPKTLIPVDGDSTILDIILANMAKSGISDIAIVAGYAAEAIVDRAGDLEARHGISISLIHNDRFDRNNAYSLWLARDAFADGALLVNGDTVHPVEVEQTLIGAAAETPEAGLLLALDVTKTLTDEAMKVTRDADGNVERITKLMPVEAAHGEYIGASLIGASVARDLAKALEETWQRDPNLYYEDGYQTLIGHGVPVGTVALPPLEWVEVDDHADLARARDLACRC